MNDFLLGVKVGVGIIVFVAIAFGLITAVYGLAKNNIIFTLVDEGTAKAIVRYGRCRKIIMSLKGYILDPKTWEIIPEAQADAATRVKAVFGRLFGGLGFVGIPFVDHVYRYIFKWTSFEQARKEKEEGVAEKAKYTEKELDYIFVRDDVYLVQIEDAETSDNIPVGVPFLLTLRIINPYKALFLIQNWLEAVSNRVKPAFRSFVRSKTYDQLQAQKEAVEEEEGSFLHDTKLDEQILEEWGVKFIAAEMGRIDLKPEYQEAASKKWAAEKEAERVLVLADAEVGRLDKVYGKVQSFGEIGVFLKTLESLEKAGAGQGNTVVFPLGSAQDLIKGWIGKKEG